MFTFLKRLMTPDPSAALSVRLTPAAFTERRHPEDPVLDVRTPDEYAQGHAVGAANVDVLAPDFRAKVEALASAGTISAERPVYLYCRSGNRSGKAAEVLRAMGFAQAYNVGGLDDLVRAGVPTER